MGVGGLATMKVPKKPYLQKNVAHFYDGIYSMCAKPPPPPA